MADESPVPGLDPADHAKFFDHYLPRVLGFAPKRTRDPRAAERLTEAIFVETVRGAGPLIPCRQTDTAIVAAAGRVLAQRGVVAD